MNQVVLVGRLTKDVELRFIAGSGTAVANFSLAIDREFSGKDGKRETDFIDIQTWGKSAENCANYIGKGSQVCVSGSIRMDRYVNNDGQKRTACRINANRVQFLDSKKTTTNTSKNDNELTFDPSQAFDSANSEMFQHLDDGDMPF